MRIIAGAYRGKKLYSLGDAAIRPTGDRVKESLFQILSDRLRGARVLDLFCGSGALGLESLSRGAAEAVFNDCSQESLTVAQKNLRAVGAKAKLLNYDYKACLARISGAFDLIFCDPPYKEDLCADVLALIKKYALLNENGLVIYESEREESPAEGWRLADMRKYGRCKIMFFALDCAQEGRE